MAETELNAGATAPRTLEQQMRAQQAAHEIRSAEENEDGNHTQGSYFEGAAAAWEAAAELVRENGEPAVVDARWKPLRIDRLPQVKPGTLLRVELQGIAIEGQLETLGDEGSAFNLALVGLDDKVDLSDPSLQVYLTARDHDALTLDPISAAYLAKTGTAPAPEIAQALAVLADAGVQLEVQE